MGDHGQPTNFGAVVAVRGSVVDIRFDAHLPPIYSLLHAQDGTIAIEVLAQLDAQRVRGIALTPTQGLARGMPVEDTGGPLQGLVTLTERHDGGIAYATQVACAIRCVRQRRPRR